MKRITLLLVLVLLLTVINVVAAQKDTKTDTDGMAPGISVECDDGTSFDNGVSITVVQMRSGFTYKATAIGIDGFDPVLAVLDAETGTGLCEDDSEGVEEYSALLPSGVAEMSLYNSQIEFANTSDEAFADISLVVGGFGNLGGEFFLILEGMYIDPEFDGIGDALAKMAQFILVRNYGVAGGQDSQHLMSIKPDILVQRVLFRYGLSPKKTAKTVADTVDKLGLDSPADFDAAVWIIGREYCSNTEPDCSGCPLNKLCKYNV